LTTERTERGQKRCPRNSRDDEVNHPDEPVSGFCGQQLHKETFQKSRGVVVSDAFLLIRRRIRISVIGGELEITRSRRVVHLNPIATKEANSVASPSQCIPLIGRQFEIRRSKGFVHLDRLTSSETCRVTILRIRIPLVRQQFEKR
jgi:hypothetical protein